MKRLLSLFLVISLVLAMVPSVCADAEKTMVINATKTERAYIEKDVSDILKVGGCLLLEYDFTADKNHMTGACFVQNRAYSRYFPVYYSGENEKLWYESNAMSGAGVGSNMEEAATEGERYHVVSLLNIKDADSTITTYVNGELVRNNVKCRMTTTEETYPWKLLRVYGGSYARFTVLDNSNFDYTPYETALSVKTEHSSYITTAKVKRADFTLTIKNKSYTARDLEQAISVPDGAEVTLMRGSYDLNGSEMVTNGTQLYIQSANRLQTIKYRIKTDINVLTSESYVIDNEACTISSVPAGTTAEALIQNINVADGFATRGVYCDGEAISGTVVNNMMLTVSGNNETLEYTLLVDETGAEIKSESYIINNDNKKIYGILKYTPYGTFIRNITTSEGTEIVGIYDGENAYTGEIDRNGLILKTRTNGVTTQWNLKIAGLNAKTAAGEEETALLGLYNKVFGKTVLVSGQLTASNNAGVSFSDLYAEDGALVICKSDGYIYFWNHRSERQWSTGDSFEFTVITDTATAEAKAYIEGELVLDHITASWFDILKNPFSLQTNYDTDNLEILPVFSLDVLAEEETVGTDNFTLVSKYYKITEGVITISGADITVKDFSDRIEATNGASFYVHHSNGDLCGDNDALNDDMYVMVRHGVSEKHYEIETMTDGIAAIGRASFYKNEIAEKNQVGTSFAIPVMAQEGQKIISEISAQDNLVISISLSNYNEESRKVNVFAAGYGKNGNLCGISAVTEIMLEGFTDGQPVSGFIPVEKLSGAEMIKIYLWGNELMPIADSEIAISSDTTLLAEKANALIENPMYRDEAPNMITTALVHPNYKGLIFDENGENDIQLIMRVNHEKLAERGKVLSDYKIKALIYDKNQNTLLTSEAEDITSEMSVVFSSKYLELGDYKLKVMLIDKTTLEETDYNLWTLRKRSGDISELGTYVDESGRFIKNGKPKFYIGMFGDDYKNLEQVEKLKDNGIDGIFLYQNAKISDMTSGWQTWFDAVYESGMDFYANAAIFYGNGDDNINFGLSKPSDEGTVVEKIVSTLKNSPAVAGYYVGDERGSETTDRFRWHQEIISAYDLKKPTVYVDWQNNRNVIFSHNASADIMGLDHYPVRYSDNDENIDAISSYTKVMKENFVNKPVWMVLQSGNRGLWWDDGTITSANPTQTPTEKQMRNMFMQAVINGAEGVWWYSYAAMMNEALDGRGIGEAVLSRIERVKDLDELLSRPLGVSRLFNSWGDIIMSDAEAPVVTFAGNNIEYTTRRYNGKTYIFAANTSIFDETAKFSINGTTSVKDIFTGETYRVSEDGSFTANIENIGIAVFEVEHSNFLSHDSEASSIAFYNGRDSYVVSKDAEGNLMVNAPERVDTINYSFEVNENASLFFNDRAVGKKGTINSNGIFKVVAEDGSFTEYRIIIK